MTLYFSVAVWLSIGMIHVSGRLVPRLAAQRKSSLLTA
jgi:hypothetical protein